MPSQLFEKEYRSSSWRDTFFSLNDKLIYALNIISKDTRKIFKFAGKFMFSSRRNTIME